jgi:peroxiredoxin
LREHYAEITRRGAEVVLIGTGNLGYAQAFAEAERIPFLVLADAAAAAAQAAAVRRVGFFRLFNPASFPGGIRAWKAGHRVGKPGPRVDQLGATFVIGPGAHVRYAHYDAHTADHAPMEEVLPALTQ